MLEIVQIWLMGELGDGARVYHQIDRSTAPGNSAAHCFSISVPVLDMTDLIMLAKRRTTLRGQGIVLSIHKIEPEGDLKAEGRCARRDFTVHYSWRDG
jgi:hypothetical protein